MPELIHSSVNPLKDAIAKVTCNGRDYWTMTGWTNPGTADIPTMFMDSIALRNQVVSALSSLFPCPLHLTPVNFSTLLLFFSFLT